MDDMFNNTSKATTFKPGFRSPSASPHFGGKIALKTSQPFVEKKLIDHEFVILRDMRNLDFCRRMFFSGITGLTVFKRNAIALTVVLVGIKAFY